jgi:hypothetical protein
MEYKANVGMVESPSKSCRVVVVVVVVDVSLVLPLVLVVLKVKSTYLLCNRSQNNCTHHPGIFV